MDDNTIQIIAGNLTTAYFTVNAAVIKGEINNSGNRQPVPTEKIWEVYQKFVVLAEQQYKLPA